MAASFSRHLLDPELDAGLAGLPPFGEMSTKSLPGLRGMMMERAQALVKDSSTPDIKVSNVFVPCRDGDPPVRLLVYAPRSAATPMPALLHIHGGGYVSGLPEQRHESSIHLVRTLGCVVVSVDYRLAPENRYPAALEDCYAGLRWLHQSAQALRIDPRRIAITGESAGGGLAAALTLLARDRGEYPICFQLLSYPMIDDRPTHDDNRFTGEFVWTRASNRFAWGALLGTAPGSADIPEYAAAARANNLAHLPPAFIAVGGLDLFVEDNLDYARRLVRAGVATELHLYPGAFHAFDLIAQAEISIRFRKDRDNALRRACMVQEKQQS